MESSRTNGSRRSVRTNLSCIFLTLVTLSRLESSLITGELNQCLITSGGTPASKVTADVTHVVASEHDWTNGAAKVKQAQDLQAQSGVDIKVVGLLWLEESFDAKSKVDETPYILSDSAPYPNKQVLAILNQRPS